MAGVNQVTLIGNLGADPEIHTFPDNGQVANLRLATSERWRDKTTGDPVERTEWHRVALFGKLAEIAGQYLQKGSKVYIQGQLRTRKWQDQTGQDRYSTEVYVGPRGQMQMLDPRPSAAAPNGQATAAPPAQRRPNPPSQARTTADAQFQNGPPPEPFDDDIPF